MKELIGVSYKAFDNSVLVVTGVTGRLIDLEVQEEGNGSLPEGAIVTLTDYTLNRYIESGALKVAEA